MEVEFIRSKDDIRVKFFGDVDEYTVKKIRDDIDRRIDDEPSLRSMTFDMQHVSFIDSTGLGFVLGRYKRLRNRHAELLLANVPSQVDKVFRTSGIYRYVPIVE